MPGDEETMKVERLRRMIKTGTVENSTRSGIQSKNEDLFGIARRLFWSTGLRRQAEYSRGKETRLIMAPIGNIPMGPYLEKSKAEESLDPDDIAVCFVFHALKTDGIRDSFLGGIAIMAHDNAERFVKMAQNDPRSLFSLARAANGGPITRHDGEPATIAPGECLVISPNEKYGGSISTEIESKPFPEGYQPNSLF